MRLLEKKQAGMMRILSQVMLAHALTCPRHGPPQGAISGHQNDSGTYYVVVCHHTSHGNIPGKSNGNKGWYSWGGKENETHDFSYVVVRRK